MEEKNNYSYNINGQEYVIDKEKRKDLIDLVAILADKLKENLKLQCKKYEKCEKVPVEMENSMNTLALLIACEKKFSNLENWPAQILAESYIHLCKSLS